MILLVDLLSYIVKASFLCRSEIALNLSVDGGGSIVMAPASAQRSWGGLPGNSVMNWSAEPPAP